MSNSSTDTSDAAANIGNIPAIDAITSSIPASDAAPSNSPASGTDTSSNTPSDTVTISIPASGAAASSSPASGTVTNRLGNISASGPVVLPDSNDPLYFAFDDVTNMKQGRRGKISKDAAVRELSEKKLRIEMAKTVKEWEKEEEEKEREYAERVRRERERRKNVKNDIKEGYNLKG